MKGIGIFVTLVFFVLAGLMLAFPKLVRKYDTRMTKFINDEEIYVFVVRIMGIVFFIGAIFASFVTVVGR